MRILQHQGFITTPVQSSSSRGWFVFRKKMHRRYVQRRWSYARAQVFGIALFFAGGTLAVTLLVSELFFSKIFASDTTQSWSFASAGEYTLSSETNIEVSAASARLKVLNYAADDQTEALFHFDESSGNPDDTSSHDNTATATNITYDTGKLNSAAAFNGTTSNLSVTDSNSLSLSQVNSIEAWTKFDDAFSAGSHSQRQGVVDKGQYQLYYDNETGKIVYELADASETSWTQVAGNEQNSSWDLDGQLAVHSLVESGGIVYAGLGNANGDAEMWSWNGTSWTKLGGDGINSSWSSLNYESVYAVETDDTYVYAALGNTPAGDGEVWRYSISGGTWTKIGGDGLNAGWAVGLAESVRSLKYANSTLYAGIGDGGNDAEVWAWDGDDWTKIGGDSTNSGWTTNYEYVYSLTADATYLYVGLGSGAGDAEVWRYSFTGGTWSKIGGDSTNTGWTTNYDVVTSLDAFGGNVYAGLGVTANEAEVWRWNGTSWTQIGGDSLNSGWTTNYEGVYSLTNDGTNLYAGLGSGGGDNEVWQWNGTAWTKLGGDGLNSSFTNTHTIIESMLYYDNVLFVANTSGNTGRTGEVWTLDNGTWARISGNYVNSSWGFRGLQAVEVMTTSGVYLYAGTGNTIAGNALVWRFDGTTWTQVGGQGVNSSWNSGIYENVTSMISHGGDLYVGLGISANEAEVWRWNGSTWTQIGGDSLNSGWTTNYEEVPSMASHGGILYVGLGSGGNDAEVWSWNGSSWTKIGGDSINSGWTTNYDRVHSLGVFQGNLVAGLGSTATESEVWQWNGSSWTKIGGDSTNSSWSGTEHESVEALIAHNNKLYAALGNQIGDADVWEYNGSTWTQIGGDDVNSSWTSGTYERVRTIVGYNGDLYAGLGNTTSEGEVWRYRNGSWTHIGGDSLNSGWSNIVEEVTSFSVYKGSLYTGLGNTQNVDAAIWKYGANAYLQSTTASHDNGWQHIAGTYDGVTMRLYIDGIEDASQNASVSMADTTHALLVGNVYGGREQGRPQGVFQGMIDELRISNSARSSFTTTAYSADPQTVRPTTAVFTSGVKNLDAFSTSETANGGSITYRLSTDNGSTWKYYNGGWTTSASTSEANTAATINSNISTLSIDTNGVLWQAILDGDGNQLVTLTEVEIGAINDSTAPTNPDTLTALSTSGGSTLTTDTWYTHSAPHFSWTAGDDGAGSGVAGYFVYFGTDETADPQTAGTFQEGTTFTASSLTSGSTYYLRIKARDQAQNIATSIWAPFTYKFDNTGPTAPGVVSVSPAGYAPTNSFTFSWPASGGNMGMDSGSGITGYQYKTATESGDLSDWSTATTSASISLENAAYQVGENTFYLRAVDGAGNVTSSPISTTYYFAGEGPSAPQFLTVTPSTNTTNSFAFSWTAPSSYSGDVGDMTYCYTVNTLPNADNCTFTSAGATSISASSFATQVGLNTVYLVARNSEESGSAINYGAYTSATFTANTSAPGIPLNTDIADISIKSTSTWRLTVSWNTPTDAVSGVSNYEIFRSADADTYTKISTTTGTAYVDTGLTNDLYYYKVRACDSVANCGAFSEVVELIPTGKYTEAATLSSGPTVSAITTKQATISWSTDRASDTKVQYGLSSGSYFSSEPSNSTQKTAHSIALTNLSPGTTYYYKAKWTDDDGNTGFAAEKTFTTDPAPVVTDPQPIANGLTSISIDFTVSGASKVKIYYGITSAFGGLKEISTSTSESVYTAILEDLEDGTKYFYKINAVDSEGAEYEGNVLSFETLPRPKISRIRIQQVRGTAQPTVLVTWETNTETSSIITYYPEGQISDARDEVSVTLQAGQHRSIIRGLLPETSYILIAKGRDKAGNEAASEPQRFTTATDTRPPQINNLKVEGSNTKVGDEQLSQLVVSWNTDEAATSQVEFAEGTGTTYSQKTQEDTNPKFDHLVVITNLSPSKVYHLRALSVDSAGNVGTSADTVTITPKATDAALDLVINNLQQVFGFLSR